MQTKQTVVAFSYRAGISSKEGSNKGNPFISFSMLDNTGEMFDIFEWNRDGRFPKEIVTPCLLEVELEVSNSNDKVKVDLLRIERKSASFSFGKILEGLKLPMEKA